MKEVNAHPLKPHLYYKLVGKEAVPCNLMEWADNFSKRVVAQHESNGIQVSTIFLGLDYNFGGDRPLLFETKIFRGWHDGYKRLYETWQQAEAGHAVALSMVKRIAWCPAGIQSSARLLCDSVSGFYWRRLMALREPRP